MPTGLMQALILDAKDAPFRLAEIPIPVPGPGQVLVRIAASGLNPLDAKIRAGAAAHARHPWGSILGIDLAGTIAALGPGPSAERFREGDEVYGMTGGVGGVPGTLAEYAVVDAALLAPKPARLSMRQAAALPLITITAWEGLVDRAHVQPGQKVLVQGGAGNVGHVAVQIAHAMGAEVFATERSGQGDFIRSLGATPIDTRTETTAESVDRHTGGKGFDLVYDTAGGPLLDASFAAVGRFGHVVSCLGWGSHSLAPLSFKAASYSGVFTLLPLLTGEGRPRHGEILTEAAALAAAGKLVPRVDPREFGLADIEAAYGALTNRQADGKLVVTIA